MDRRQLLVPAVALAILALAAAPAVASPVQSAEARAEHQRIVDFWTPARMKAAIPRRVERPLPAFGPAGRAAGGAPRDERRGSDDERRRARATREASLPS